jgi:predicted nucleic acid-binding protein
MVDTNVLLEATDEGRRLHGQALAVFQSAPEQGVDLFICTQVVREYLVVATRPIENNGLGMDTAKALANISRFRRRASLIGETLRACEVLLELAGKLGIHGKRLHDLQIFATAACAGMDGLLTANEADFPRLSSIALTTIPLADIQW